MMLKDKIGFIGAGRMAEAIAGGLIDAFVFDKGAIMASDVDAARRDVFAALGCHAVEDNRAVVKACRLLLVAVKPQNLDTLLPQIGPSLSETHLLLTICAGCPTRLFERTSNAPLRVVRAMPNMPMRVRQGVTALCPGAYATEEDLRTAETVFGAAGKVVRVDEGLMDAVTALSGSGPAYACFLAEVMIEAGQAEGLPADVARELALRTLRGAAEMMIADVVPPGELRKRVTSKGGTTEAAFRYLDDRNVREAWVGAIHAAAVRAKELGKG